MNGYNPLPVDEIACSVSLRRNVTQQL
jgi:hypothetical protein